MASFVPSFCIDTRAIGDFPFFFAPLCTTIVFYQLFLFPTSLFVTIEGEGGRKSVPAASRLRQGRALYERRLGMSFLPLFGCRYLSWDESEAAILARYVIVVRFR